MQSLITSCHLALPQPMVVSSNRITLPMARYTKVIRRGRGIKSTVLAHQGDDMECHGFGHGRMVDEDIITLRLRMKELMSRSEGEDELPLEWMEWERNYFGYFEKDVYALVRWLQMALMNTRPCLAVGMVAFLAFSIMTSVALLSLHGIQICKGIVNGLS